jgi:transcriptional regulator GlxA family with amidase domain
VQVALSNGLYLQAKSLPAQVKDARTVWIVPGLGLANPAELQARLRLADIEAAGMHLRQHLAQGGTVAASCSAVFLLQTAGMLAGRKVTTSWWLAALLQQLEPQCTVNSHRMVCDDSPIITAGAAFAHMDLMLHLLRARFGAPLADAVSRLLLVDGRQAQAPFVVPALLAGGHALIARITSRLESALPNLPTVGQLAQELSLNERTLARHVKAATGHSTLALFQSVRLHRARALIESSRLSIEEVAEQVGYGDATALRRMMRKLTGTRPSQFRAGQAFA